MKIKINNEEYNIRYTIRAMFIFEQITGKSFSIDTMMDNYVFLYSMILASNRDKIIEWDDFIDAIDEDNTIIMQFNKMLHEHKRRTEILGGDANDDSEVKKK